MQGVPDMFEGCVDGTWQRAPRARRVGLLGLVIEPTVSDRHAEMLRLRSALHDLRRPIDVLVYS